MAKNGTTDNVSKEESVPAITFEQAMEKLETIVARLESGDVPLETAIELFQEGMSLSKLCGQKLEQVERRIEMLVEGDAGLQRKPFAAVKEEA
ncbi:exodeoxyribonuclease VII small subunit [Cohnella luojiensis]|uniref:Exodeoxyribonuclease 7 small subunit n=1 Tax=Cohnella luojiensis TaxID=652876 RepID=A0A4Y8M390_9BACL|nr:exodeoxyribonuclease VII small subunit [Cohnella luojiensis]TFE29901.1 exodeoxyribonuclease VII small subunit [Cohnella luojiensis]